jgi:hypothetical protein
MTIEQVCCVFFGAMLQTLTFAFGIIVGASLRRKEPNREAKVPGACGSKCRG